MARDLYVVKFANQLFWPAYRFHGAEGNSAGNEVPSSLCKTVEVVKETPWELILVFMVQRAVKLC